MAVELQTVDELRQFIKHHKTAVIDFYADWCVPCKALAPQFESLSADESFVDKRVSFAKFNIDIDLPTVKSSEFNVRAVPSVLIFTNCGEKSTLVQKPSGETIKSRVESLI